MILKSHCEFCIKADYGPCKPDRVCLICRDNGVGITSSNIELLKIVGCGSFRYDGCGLTDLERSFHKVRNYRKYIETGE